MSISFFRTRMSIRHRLMANAIITVCLALLVASSLYISTQELAKASKMDEFADQIVKDVSILNSLGYAYLLLKGERPRMQWQLKHDSLGRLLSEQESPSTETQALLERLQQNHKQIRDLFDLLSMRAGQDRSSPTAGSSSYNELNEGVTAQLMTRAELMVNDASLLARLAGQKVDRLRRITFILVVASAVFLILSAVATSTILIRSIGGSMSELNQGVRKIASGDLEYRVRVRGNDEISLVATSFNDMAAKLATSNQDLLQLNQTLEQRVAERTAQLEASEGKLRRLYESGMLGVLYWNMDGDIVDANDRFLEMIGYNREELAAGKIDWINMTPPEFRHVDELSTMELRARGVNRVPFEKECVRKDGTRMPVIVAGAMLDEERFNGVAFVLDITKHKQAEEALRESEERLSAIYAGMTEGVASHEILYADGTAVDYVVTEVNQAFESITGIPRAAAVGKKASELYNTGTVPYLDVYARVASTGKPESFETYFPPMEKHFAISVFSMGTGKFATVFSDITERKKTEEEIRRYLDELRDANDELARFNKAMVGRELRMVELKKEVNELEARLGEPPRYEIEGEAGE